ADHQGHEQRAVLIFNAALPENVSADWRKQRLVSSLEDSDVGIAESANRSIINHMLFVDVR
ncbi:hypothetical protein PSYJA_41247, partial [Pseudomonas syringae pv. japonica str. M301072]